MKAEGITRTAEYIVKVKLPGADAEARRRLQQDLFTAIYETVRRYEDDVEVQRVGQRGWRTDMPITETDSMSDGMCGYVELYDDRTSRKERVRWNVKSTQGPTSQNEARAVAKYLLNEAARWTPEKH